MLFAQLVADVADEAVVGDVSDITNAKFCRICDATDGSADDERDVAFAAVGDEVDFVFRIVHGIDDEAVVIFKKTRCRALGVEFMQTMDLAFWCYLLDAGGHHLGLRLAYGASEGVDLAVDVSDADFVEIDERELADARAGEGFCCPAADSTDADDGNVGTMKML